MFELEPFAFGLFLVIVLEVVEPLGVGLGAEIDVGVFDLDLQQNNLW